MLYGVQKINGKWYMFEKNSGAKISYQKGRYLKSVGKKRILKKNAYIYVKKGIKKYTYGSVVIFKGKK